MDLFVTLLELFGAPVFWVAVGLVAGWNLLPQPAFVQRWYQTVATYVKSKLAK